MKGRSRTRPDAGMTLVEVVIALTIFAGLFMALAAASQQSLLLANRARSNLHVWAATQRVADSLIALDPADLSPGTQTVDDVDFSWTAPDASAVHLVISYTVGTTDRQVRDTLFLYRN